MAAKCGGGRWRLDSGWRWRLESGWRWRVDSGQWVEVEGGDGPVEASSDQQKGVARGTGPSVPPATLSKGWREGGES